MAKKTTYICDACINDSDSQNTPYPVGRKYTIHVNSCKFTVKIVTSNVDELCDECFDKLIQNIEEANTNNEYTVIKSVKHEGV